MTATYMRACSRLGAAELDAELVVPQRIRPQLILDRVAERVGLLVEKVGVRVVAGAQQREQEGRRRRGVSMRACTLQS